MALRLIKPSRLTAAAPAWQYGEAGHSITPGSGTAFSFTGLQTGATIAGHVYFPDGYDPAEADLYPIIYFLHGKGGNSSTFGAQIIPSLEAAFAAEQIRPCIGVFLSAGNTWYINDYNGGAQMRTQYVDELMAHFELHTRCVPGRAGRLAYGFSMGGHGAMSIAFGDPSLFLAVNAMTAPFVDVDLLHNGNTPFETEAPLAEIWATEETMRVDTPVYLLQANAAAIIASGLKIRGATGDEDDNPAGIESMANLDAKLTAAGITHTYSVLAGIDDHNLATYVATDNEAGFIFLEAALAAA